MTVEPEVPPFTAEELAILEADAGSNPESADLLRRYRVAKGAMGLIRVLGALVHGHVKADDVPVIVAQLRYMADALEADRPTLN
ncbi:hypothetical protein LRS10_16890 [Phenylobacterium sp. J426]|uniref:hypothetical protein n=1 Tax=Phenylobacterium sp. J426 TaxID=2898439 RepID=UPI0021513BB4|nr:hypothetical protein [Phenylobacterium sp. J426]MCR5875694.1 hypothetical protein [Phenylobacterium sp. J426]